MSFSCWRQPVYATLNYMPNESEKSPLESFKPTLVIATLNLSDKGEQVNRICEVVHEGAFTGFFTLRDKETHRCYMVHKSKVRNI